MADEVDARVETVQATLREAVRDRPSADARPGQLSSGYDPGLLGGYPGEYRVDGLRPAFRGRSGRVR